MRDVQIREAWVLCFLLGVVMINYPFLHIFNKSNLIFGVPVLYLYFLLGWPLAIMVIYLFCRTLRHERDEEGGGGGDREQG